MFTGAVSTWKPLGGGGASITGGGFGGSAFLTSTNSTFSSRFSCCCVAWSVAYAAAVITAAWKVTLKMNPPSVRCRFALDSRRLLNKSVLLSGVVNREGGLVRVKKVAPRSVHGKTRRLTFP